MKNFENKKTKAVRVNEYSRLEVESRLSHIYNADEIDDFCKQFEEFFFEQTGYTFLVYTGDLIVDSDLSEDDSAALKEILAEVYESTEI